ncbi:transporter [Fusarium langsethiae]|uniref:Transporter n=1 Tax=Fusarium langsethiae TaxID=179993 RepID=A0A0M9EST5_FUSLA|nr:transporter [Fusarium langsethiae]
MCTTSAGGIPEVPAMTADLNIILLVVQIDELWPYSAMEKADHTILRLSYLGSWAMITLARFIRGIYLAGWRWLYPPWSSGGERQRVALARVLSQIHEILIFDEATSALDAHTEDHIKESIKSIGAGRTTIIIAHRLSTVMHADKIIVLGKMHGVGVIEQQGTHQELIKCPGVYLNIWKKHIGQA